MASQVVEVASRGVTAQQRGKGIELDKIWRQDESQSLKFRRH